VPQSGPVRMEYRGLPLDLIEDLLEKSPAWLQAQRVTHAQRKQFFGRPLTPLHAGHVGLCAVSGLLNGVFGSGTERHVAHWEAIKENVINYTRWVGWLPTLSGNPSVSPSTRS
jgi:hypothetical protein